MEVELGDCGGGGEVRAQDTGAPCIRISPCARGLRSGKGMVDGFGYFSQNPVLCRLSLYRAGWFGEVRAGIRHQGLAQCGVMGLHSGFASVGSSGGFHLNKNARVIQHVYFCLYSRSPIPSAGSLKSFPLHLLSFQSREGSTCTTLSFL